MNVPRILINRHQAGSFGHRKNDVILEGDLVEIVQKLSKKLNWNLDTV